GRTKRRHHRRLCEFDRFKRAGPSRGARLGRGHFSILPAAGRHPFSPRCECRHGAESLKRIVNLCNHGAMSPTLGADLLAVVARINRLATQRVRMPLGFAQARLLSTIEDQGATRISDLAALDHCSQPTMTNQVRRLEDAGLVSRTVDPDDARAVLIRITPKGVDTLRQVRVDRGAAIDPYLERLDAADREALSDAVRVLRRLLADAAAPTPIK